jgi:hypothetical protein
MIRLAHLAAAFGIVAATSGAILAQGAYGGARHYPPCSCGQFSAVPEQRSTPSAAPPQRSTPQATISQVSTTYYPAAKDTAVPVRPVSTSSQTYENSASHIGPLYGKALSSWSSAAGHSGQPANQETGPWYDHAGTPFQSSLDQSHFFGY